MNRLFVAGRRPLNFRHYQPGDESAQLAIYNTVGASLPKFKPATLFEIQRRTQNKDFDPTTRYYAVDQGKTVAYSTFQCNGRISYPWCLPGHESAAEPLFNQFLQAMKQRGIRTAFAAYRGDWPTVNDFFKKFGFVHARDMVNFVLAFDNMPTPSARVRSSIAPATPEDIPKIFALAPSIFRAPTAEALQQALFHNPYLARNEVFIMPRGDGSPLAAATFITNPTYADPRTVDSSMPCFRLGAFGTEGMTTKRIKGMFSLAAALDKSLFGLGMDFLAYRSEEHTS